GQVVSIIGPNGAGKSTVFKTVFGLLPALAGRVLLSGEDVTNRSPAELLRRGMAYVPQGRNVFPLMTVEENLLLGAYTRPRSAELTTEVERAYATFPALREARRKRAGDLSGRQQQMLEMARALLLKPRLILLDEHTLGLAPLVFKEIFRSIEELRRLRVGEVVVTVRADAALVGAADSLVANHGAQLPVAPQGKDAVLGERRAVECSRGVGADAGHRRDRHDCLDVSGVRIAGQVRILEILR